MLLKKIVVSVKLHEPSTTPPIPTKCPQGWAFNDGSCYKVFSDKGLIGTMNEAESYCQGFGSSAHLASVLNNDQKDFLRMKIPYGDFYYIGLRQKAASTDDDISTFEWVDGSVNSGYNLFSNYGELTHKLYIDKLHLTRKFYHSRNSNNPKWKFKVC